MPFNYLAHGVKENTDKDTITVIFDEYKKLLDESYQYKTRVIYPNIYKAAIEIAYDNGCINRDHPEDNIYVTTADALGRTEKEILIVAEMELASLTAEELNLLCTAGYEEALQIKVCKETHELLDFIFEQM